MIVSNMLNTFLLSLQLASISFKVKESGKASFAAEKKEIKANHRRLFEKECSGCYKTCI